MRSTVDLFAGAAVAVRAAVAARSAKTAAIVLTSVPTPPTNAPSAVIATQTWLGSTLSEGVWGLFTVEDVVAWLDGGWRVGPG